MVTQAMGVLLIIGGGGFLCLLVYVLAKKKDWGKIFHTHNINLPSAKEPAKF